MKKKFYFLIKIIFLFLLIYILFYDDWYNPYSSFCNELKVYCQLGYKCILIDLFKGILMVFLFRYFTSLSLKIISILCMLFISLLAMNIHIEIFSTTFIFFTISYMIGILFGLYFSYRFLNFKVKT